MSQQAQRRCAVLECGKPAVAAVHLHGARKTLPTILIRPDHLARLESAADFRCRDCLHVEVDLGLGITGLHKEERAA